MNQKINVFCQQLCTEFDKISEERKQLLLKLSDYIQTNIIAQKTSKLIVICTHNSRRSHLGQLWLAVGAEYFDLPKIETFSGGTETTAFNPRAVNAIQKVGFEVKMENNGENPFYHIKWSDKTSVYKAFSKKYDDLPNPKQDFGAILVCTNADEGCPVVFGSDFRIALPFEDPKNYDNTALESAKYEERCADIGREMLFVLSQIER